MAAPTDTDIDTSYEMKDVSARRPRPVRVGALRLGEPPG